MPWDLAIRMRVEGLTPRPLQPPRRRPSSAPVLRAGSASEAGVANDAKKRIDAVCRSWADDSKEPFVTLVARHGVIVTHKAFGRDRDTGAPIGLDFRADVFSITKTITAMLFSRFVDQHLLDLDESVGRVFPNYPSGPHVPTFRQCLTHMSGLSGHGDFGGVRNPQLDNVVLNGIDANRPGQAYSYAGMGYDLTAKAMELTTGICAMRLYHDALFEPLGIGDVPMEIASSGAQPTAMQLAVLAQWLANRGSYGEMEFISPATFQRMLPEPLDKRYPGVTNLEEGIGMHWMRPLKSGAAANSHDPKDLILSPNTIGHGSFSSSMLLVDLDRDLIIVQIRSRGGPRFIDWSTQFLQTIVEAVD